MLLPDIMVITKVFLLLLVANGTPIITKRLLGSKLAYPLDGGKKFIDGQPWLGKSKTIRGIISSIIVTSIFAVFIGYSLQTGALFSIASLTGDLVSSFIKRRMGLVPGSRATGLDQLPESIFPLLLLWSVFKLDMLTAVCIVVVFFIAEVILSRALFQLHIRDHPY